jgi:hypothetical protein
VKSRDSKKIIRELAQRYNLTMSQVEDIVRSPFEFQVHVMKTKCEKWNLVFPTVRIPGFGMFFFPDSSRKTLEEYNKKKQDGRE